MIGCDVVLRNGRTIHVYGKLVYPGDRVKGGVVDDVTEGPWEVYSLAQISAIVASHDAAIVPLGFLGKVMGGKIDTLLSAASKVAADGSQEKLRVELERTLAEAMRARGESEIFRVHILSAYVMNEAGIRARIAARAAAH